MEHTTHKPGTLVCFATETTLHKRAYKVDPNIKPEYNLEMVWIQYSGLDAASLLPGDPVVLLRMEVDHSTNTFATCLALHPEHGLVIFKLFNYPEEMLVEVTQS